MKNASICGMTNEDWFNQGKADAWEGRPKKSPEHDPEAASMYDLGYCEGELKASPTSCKTPLVAKQ
ncbi:MAG: hypothetical protein QNJ70_06000 [Xenococcaceae cyanobacterium MO_207.B15]|nr:hypothetical protein [Xenococcaceae cyanobacterium MO_207.B15]